MAKIEQNEIFSILADWNFWQKDLASGIPRPDYLDKLSGFLKSNQVVTITGPRRAGKSIIMRQMVKSLIEAGVKKNEILMVNFEDPRFIENDVSFMEKIYETYREFIHPSGRPYIFLDEVQAVNGWEKWVRMMQELGKARIVVSGSNSKLLSRELGTLLTGRHLDLTVLPLSFSEFLKFKNLTVTGRTEKIIKKTEIRVHLRQYFEFGAFPEVVLSSQKKEILLNYFEDLVLKDILRRFGIRKPQILRALLRFYLSNTGSPATYTSIEKFLQASADTIEKFSGYFEDVYLVFSLKRFSFKVKEQEKSPRKIYAIDTGLANAVGFRISENAGHLAENLVFLELLRRRAFSPEAEIYYWKDEQHREVDFVIRQPKKSVQLIQVCWRLSEEKTRKRELGSLLKAMKELKVKEALVITDDQESSENIENRKIVYQPLWKWLLGK